MKRSRASIAVFMITIIIVGMFATVTAAEPPPDGYLPLRASVEQIGGVVEWNAQDRSIHIEIFDSRIVLFPERTQAYVNENTFTIQHSLVLWEDISYIFPDDINMLLKAAMPSVTLRLTPEARDLALADYDFMTSLILENSIWPYVTEERLGIDMAGLLAHNRTLIENMTPIDMPSTEMFKAVYKEGDDPQSLAANYLFVLQWLNFTKPIMSTGHMFALPAELYALVMNIIGSAEGTEGSFLTQKMLETYKHPKAVWFYGENILAEVEGFQQNPDNIWTEIITRDEIALMGIKSFMNNPELDDAVIMPFLKEIEGYSHLIIDIRGNGGGNAGLYNELVLSRLISEPFSITLTEFFAGGEMAREWADVYVKDAAATGALCGMDLVEAKIVPAADFVKQNNMTQFNQDNLEILQNVSIIEYLMRPAKDHINFKGNIWILIDAGSASASTSVAYDAKTTGYATVVGENTSNIMGVMQPVTVLPNTGILWRVDIGFMTDKEGRSLEVYGIAPDVPNRPGMDALETVLALIAEGGF